MDDVISRQTAIDALARMMPHSYTPDGSHPADEEIFRAQEVFADCIEALEILPSAQPEINCSEFPNNSDTISRQTAIDALCKQCTVDRPETCSTIQKGDKWCEEVYTLLKLPSAQPEIIRCKDCKYAHLTVSGECKYCDAWTDDHGYPMEIYEDGDFFCGNAERAEE